MKQAKNSELIKHILCKIENQRKKKGLSIFKLTELSELSENTIYSWYNRGAEPSILALSAVCNILNISMSELFSITENEFLSAQEEELISQFRKLSENKRKLILELSSELQ